MTHFSGVPHQYSAYPLPAASPRKVAKPTKQEETTAPPAENTTGKRALQLGGTLAASTGLGVAAGYVNHSATKGTPEPISTEPPTLVLQDPLKQQQKTPEAIQQLWDAEEQKAHDHLRLEILSEQGAFTPTEDDFFNTAEESAKNKANDIANLPTKFEKAEAQLTQVALERKTPYSNILKELEPIIEADVSKIPIVPLENDTSVTNLKQAFQQATETLETVKTERAKLHLQALSNILGVTSAPLTTVPVDIRRQVLMDRTITGTLEILKQNDFDEPDLKKIFSDQPTKQAFEHALETKTFEEITTHINGLSSPHLTATQLATAKELLIQNYVTNNEIALHKSQGTLHLARANPSESLAAALRQKNPTLTRTQALEEAKKLLNLNEMQLKNQFGDVYGAKISAGQAYQAALVEAHQARWTNIKTQLETLGVKPEQIDTFYQKYEKVLNTAVNDLDPKTITKSEQTLQTLVKRILEQHHVQTPQGKNVVRAQAKAIWDAAEKEITQKLTEAEEAFKNKHTPSPHKAPAKTATVAGSFVDELFKGGGTSKVAATVALGTLLLGTGLTAYSAYQDGNKLKTLQAERAKLSLNG
jgi:hypothetical protein